MKNLLVLVALTFATTTTQACIIDDGKGEYTEEVNRNLFQIEVICSRRFTQPVDKVCQKKLRQCMFSRLAYLGRSIDCRENPEVVEQALLDCLD